MECPECNNELAFEVANFAVVDGDGDEISFLVRCGHGECYELLDVTAEITSVDVASPGDEERRRRTA